MSEDESIISEDMEYRSNDESVSYHASREDYEDDTSEVSRPASIKGRQEPPLPPVPRKEDASKVKEIKKILPVISRINSMSDESYNDDYSAEFDDASALYSNDFEVEKDKPVDMLKQDFRTEKVTITNDAVIAGPPPTKGMRLPGVDFVSLQAEIALEEISKEVVRLRNQQRNLLQERRHIAREKKTRAESRRAQYEVELRELKRKLSESEERYREQLSHTSNVEKSLEHTIYGKNILQSDLEIREKESDEVKLILTEVQNKLNECVQNFAIERSLMKAKEEKWGSERADFHAEALRAQLLASVVQQSLEVNEMR